MSKNPSLDARLKSLKGDWTLWRTVKQKLTEDLYDIQLLKNFFKAWQSSGYTAALGTLPVDDPGTEFNEGISESDLKNKGEKSFDLSWNQVIDPKNDGGEPDSEEFNQRLTELQNKVYGLLGKMSLVDLTIRSTKDELDDLRVIQRSA